MATATLPRMQEKYLKDIVPALTKEFKYSSPMQVPKLHKIVINVGLGEATQNAKVLEAVEKEITAISGQHPITTRARRSIAAFKLRAGVPIGIMVTLRGRRMYEFFDKLISTALPRVRDFQGIPADAFDGRGNYSLGIKEQIVFSEVEYDKVDKVRSLQVIIVTTATSDEQGKRLLELFGMPFERD